MKFSINQSELQNALGIVSKGLSTRSTLPILSGVYIEAKDDSVIFQTTNLEISIKYETQALVEEPGEIVAPGKLLIDIIKNLPDAAVQLQSQSSDSLHIDCAGASFEVRSLNPDDFPAFPEVAPYQSVSIPFSLLSTMVKKVSRVVSRDESHMILTGILIEINHTDIRFVATDSYRLAISQQTLPEEVEEPFSAVVSGSFLNDIAGMSASDEPVTLSLSENQIIVIYKNVVLINRRIEGDFPNYRRLLPNDHACRVLFDREELSGAVKRSSLMGTTITPVKFSINVDEGSILLSSSTQDIGSVQESLKCDIEGESMEIAFNSAYIIDGLNSSGAEKLAFETNSPFKPGIFKTHDSDEYLYLVMPVRIS